MNKRKVYKQIFSLRLAGWLMYNGCRIKRIHHNLKDGIIDKDVYLFDDTPELETAMIEYKKLKQAKERKNYGNINKRSRGNSNWQND